MAGIQNKILFSDGEKLQTSSAADILQMQELSTDISRINYVGNPEGNVSANPSSLCHDPVSGNTYLKITGTGNTGWVLNGMFSPNKVIQYFDDYLLGTPSQSSTAVNIPSTATNSGIVQLTGNLGGGFFVITASTSGVDAFVLGGGRLSVNIVFDLGTLSTALNSYTTYIGLIDSTSALADVAPVDGLYFQYTDSVNGGRWQIVSTQSGVSTVADSGVLATTGFHNFGIVVNPNASSVNYYIDGTLIVSGPLTTNIPTAGISPAMVGIDPLGTMPDQFLDLIYFEQVFTLAR